VFFEGQELEYQGILYSRFEPTEESYIILNPNQTISKVLDLSECYDITSPGLYHLTSKSRNWNRLYHLKAYYTTEANFTPIVPSDTIIPPMIKGKMPEVKIQYMNDLYLNITNIDLFLPAVKEREEVKRKYEEERKQRGKKRNFDL